MLLLLLNPAPFTEDSVSKIKYSATVKRYVIVQNGETRWDKGYFSSEQDALAAGKALFMDDNVTVKEIDLKVETTVPEDLLKKENASEIDLDPPVRNAFDEFLRRVKREVREVNIEMKDVAIIAAHVTELAIRVWAGDAEGIELVWDCIGGVFSAMRWLNNGNGSGGNGGQDGGNNDPDGNGEGGSDDKGQDP